MKINRKFGCIAALIDQSTIKIKQEKKRYNPPARAILLLPVRQHGL